MSKKDFCCQINNLTNYFLAHFELVPVGIYIPIICSNWYFDCFTVLYLNGTSSKVETILKGSLASIPSPSPSMEIQIMGDKVCLRCKGKTLLGIVNKLLKTKSLLTSPSNVLPYYTSSKLS